LLAEDAVLIRRRQTGHEKALGAGRLGQLIVELNVRIAEYFYVRVEAAPGKAYELLRRLADEDISLLAFSAVPFGPNHIELTIFPDKSDNLVRLARKMGWLLLGPQHACLVQGDDHLGALAEVQQKLYNAGVSIYASTGVTDGLGHYGYVIYMKEADHEIAAAAFGDEPDRVDVK
jgi:hypothetical protein